ncbi:cysteine desulfurase family protein [Flavobacterium ardleyense]|uniref:cysteine desulfurase family protein n=1 Tax=Flavobacterium ardleyense TaxID=2038737 RepID=UPI00298C8C4B|nr:cysteine desulfurase family protein [Flavobacterium ardleyense]
MHISYLDSASTTKTSQRVLDTMLPYFTELYGNASSSHKFGEIVKEAVDKARMQVASIIGAESSEIIFTSGATESVNLALKGFVDANYDKGNHIITVKTEHKAALETCSYLEERGFEVTYLNASKDGTISLQELKDSIRPETLLISVMYVNNETGVIQEISKIGEIARQNNIAFFCDATQAVGKISVDVDRDNIDMLCFSGHKISGPKGVGVLYKKRGIQLTPLIHGGGQEGGLRAGTYNSPAIVGIGKACEIAEAENSNNSEELRNINEYILQKLMDIEGVQIVGNKDSRVSNILNVIVPGLDSNLFIARNNEFAVSNGSACNSNLVQVSHVLKAMGFTDKECESSVRISFDYNSKIEQIDQVVKILKE